MGKRRKYKPRSFESDGRPNDTSANIYESMLQSKAFKDLTTKQRELYVYAKGQRYGKKKPGKDYKDYPEFQGDELFYLNFGLVKAYGIYTEGNKGEFYKNIKALVEHGFIEVVSSGAKTHSKSIYRYSDRWQTWEDS